MHPHSTGLGPGPGPGERPPAQLRVECAKSEVFLKLCAENPGWVTYPAPYLAIRGCGVAH